jgi:hypothetical protein
MGEIPRSGLFVSRLQMARSKKYFFQPPEWLFAPIGGTAIYKKQFGVFVQIFNILRKKKRNLFQNRWNRISIRFYFTEFKGA